MKEVLMSHTVASLKKMVSAYNIKGYSKMKKPALIDLMTSKEHKNKFSGIKARVKAPKLVKKPKKDKKRRSTPYLPNDDSS